jgi:hypothetical protein
LDLLARVGDDDPKRGFSSAGIRCRETERGLEEAKHHEFKRQTVKAIPEKSVKGRDQQETRQRKYVYPVKQGKTSQQQKEKKKQSALDGLPIPAATRPPAPAAVQSRIPTPAGHDPCLSVLSDRLAFVFFCKAVVRLMRALWLSDDDALPKKRGLNVRFLNQVIKGSVALATVQKVSRLSPLRDIHGTAHVAKVSFRRLNQIDTRETLRRYSTE